MNKQIFPDYQRNTRVISKKAPLDRYAEKCLMIIWLHKNTIKRAIKKIDPDARITFRYTFNKLMNIKRVKLKHCWGYANMSESFLIGTILHETLHNIAYHKNKTPFTEEEDHRFMRLLGEIC
jgi:hypothetical protein